MSDAIDVDAMIVRFTPNAMQDAFESGAFASYDATELQILAPAHFVGKKLTIYHTERLDPTSRWREVNRKLRFSIKADDLKGDNILFDGAIWDLRDSN